MGCIRPIARGASCVPDPKDLARCQRFWNPSHEVNYGRYDWTHPLLVQLLLVHSRSHYSLRLLLTQLLSSCALLYRDCPLLHPPTLTPLLTPASHCTRPPPHSPPHNCGHSHPGADYYSKSGKLSGLLTMRTLVAKMVGITAALGSGLSIGKEGPWVHFSAILAYQLSRFSFFNQLTQTPKATLNILSAGFAAGTAANFGCVHSSQLVGVLMLIGPHFTLPVTLTSLRSHWFNHSCLISAASTTVASQQLPETWCVTTELQLAASCFPLK